MSESAREEVPIDSLLDQEWVAKNLREAAMIRSHMIEAMRWAEKELQTLRELVSKQEAQINELRVSNADLTSKSERYITQNKRLRDKNTTLVAELESLKLDSVPTLIAESSELKRRLLESDRKVLALADEVRRLQARVASASETGSARAGSLHRLSIASSCTREDPAKRPGELSPTSPAA